MCIYVKQPNTHDVRFKMHWKINVEFMMYRSITTHDEPQEVIREDERNIIYFENYFTAIFKLIISSTEH